MRPLTSRSSIGFEAGALAVEGFETRVWVARDGGDPPRMKSQPIPAEVLAPFRPA